MTKYAVHPDLQKFGNIAFPMEPALLPFVRALFWLGTRTFRFPKGLNVQKLRVPYGGRSIPVMAVAPEDIGSNAPCLLYLHGGGFVFGSSPLHLKLVREYAQKTPCLVLLADYRLAPKHPFPAGVEDCYAVLQWAAANASVLGIDPDRIALGGDSSGGALAASVSLMARDRGGKSACFLLLSYPVADARQETASIKAFTDTPLWNAKSTSQMWGLYLKNGYPKRHEYASPLEAESFAGLPDAYIETAEFDCLRDEGIALAKALESAGSQVEYHMVNGAAHGFELAYESEMTRESIERRVRALQQAYRME